MKSLVIIAVCFVSMTGCSRNAGPAPSVGHAAILMSEGRLEKAIGQCDAVLTEEPLNFHALLLRAQIHEQVGQRDLAIDDCVVAISLRPADKQARSLHASLVPPATVHAQPPNPPIVDRLMNPALTDSLPSRDRYPSTPNRDHARPRKRNGATRVRSPPSIYDQLRHAIEASDQRLSADELVARDRLSERHTGWEEIPLDAPPRQIVRFDLASMGIDPSCINSPPAATGRRNAYQPLSEDADQRNRMLVGQTISPCNGPQRSGMTVFIPQRIVPSEEASRPPFDRSCADGLDNNGDGRTDRRDPMCWQDRTHPSSYSPDLYESGRPLRVPAVPSSLPKTVAK